MNLKERREWVEAEVGRLPDFLWSSLVDRRAATAGQMDEADEEILLEQAKDGLRLIREARRSDGAAHLRRVPHTGTHSHSFFISEAKLRRRVFADCVAAAASKHPKVLAFRNEALRQSFPLTYKQALRYVDQDGRVRREAPHSKELKALSETLARSCLWSDHDASWFVLTGSYTPPIATPTVETRVAGTEGGPEIGTITLTVEPWLPAETVAEMYKKVQRQMLGKKPHQVSRSRLRLLEYVEERGEGLSWRECMDLWNEDYPEETYKDPRNFSKACKQVRKLVLDPGYQVIREDRTAARKERRRRVKSEIRRMDYGRRVVEYVERQMELALGSVERTQRDDEKDDKEN